MELKEAEQSYFSSLQKIQGNKIKNHISQSKDINGKTSEQSQQNYSNQKTSDNTKEINDNFKQIQVEIEIFSVFPQKEQFKKQFTSEKPKRGRPKEEEKKNKNNKERNKGKYRKGNACYRIFTSCIKNMHYFIKLKYKGLENLYMPNSTNNKKKSHDSMRESINKTLYDTYCEEAKPRRFQGDSKIKEDDKENKKQLRKIKYLELNKNKNIIDKFLLNCNEEEKILFKTITKKDFLMAYLKDENIIIKNDKNGKIIIDLKGFETYSDCFNGEYSKEEKEKFKIHVLEIIDNKSNDRNKIESNL